MLQKFSSLGQHNWTVATASKSYATIGEKRNALVLTKQILQQQYSTTTPSSNQKPNVAVAAAAPNTSRHSMESVMGRLDSFYQWNGFIGNEQLQPVLEQMKTGGKQLSHEQGLFLLNICGCEMPSLTSSERMANFQEVWQYLQDADMITRDHYHIMLNVLQYNQHPLSDYKTLLQEYEKLEGSAKEIYSDLLAIAGATGNVKQTTELLAEMRSLQLALSERDFNSLLLANARAKDMTGFETVKDSMHAAGLSLSLNTQSTLFVVFMENGDKDKALSILQDHAGQFEPEQVLGMLRSVNESPIGSKELVKQLVKELKPEYVKCVEVPLALRRVCVEFLHNK